MNNVTLNRRELVKAYPVPTSYPGLTNWIKSLGFPRSFNPPHKPLIWTQESVVEWFDDNPSRYETAIRTSALWPNRDPIGDIRKLKSGASK